MWIPLSRRHFWELIDELSQEGMTVLVTTHYLDEAEHCHRIAVMSAGKLAALGTTAELKRVFAGRAIVEVQAHDAVAAMRELEADARGREDEPVRNGSACRPARSQPDAGAGRDRSANEGHHRRARGIASSRRSRTCSLTLSNGSAR